VNTRQPLSNDTNRRRPAAVRMIADAGWAPDANPVTEQSCRSSTRRTGEGSSVTA
jgi:hypothetical protein